MKDTLADAHISAADIDYINAHATGTIQGDAAEAEAVAEVFGSDIPVSSLKGYFGHTLGASGAIELIVTLMMMKEKTLIPGRNLEEPAEDCSMIKHIRELTEIKDADYIIKNGFAFGGVNASLICSLKV
jgi:3-oxoacyl-[acyl-carrier-protein] synthase II